MSKLLNHCKELEALEIVSNAFVVNGAIYVRLNKVINNASDFVDYQNCRSISTWIKENKQYITDLIAGA